MGRPQVKTERYMYTEDVFYDSDGSEVERVRISDDTWFNTLSRRDATEDEIADYGLTGNEGNK